METKERFIEALGRLNADQQPVHLEISKAELWQVLSQLQLAFRHPQNVGPSRQFVEKLAEDLASAITVAHPDLRLLWNMGKQPAFDHVVPMGGRTSP